MGVGMPMIVVVRVAVVMHCMAVLVSVVPQFGLVEQEEKDKAHQ